MEFIIDTAYKNSTLSIMETPLRENPKNKDYLIIISVDGREQRANVYNYCCRLTLVPYKLNILDLGW